MGVLWVEQVSELKLGLTTHQWIVIIPAMVLPTPFGLQGGTPGIGGGNYREDLSTGHRDYCSSKGYLKIEKGQAWVGVSSGGGGFGDPLERDPNLVVEHVRDGIISGDTAKNIYGVIFNEETLILDAAATVETREALKKKQGELSSHSTYGSKCI